VQKATETVETGNSTKTADMSGPTGCN